MAAEDTAPANIARSVTGNPVFLLTALGLILYGILRLANSIFYERLAVKPEEVGLGYAETLSQSAVGVLLVLAIGFAVFGVVIFLALYVLPAVVRQGPVGGPSPETPATPFQKVMLGALFALVVAGSVTAYAVGGAHTFWTVVEWIGIAIGVIAGGREMWAELRAGDQRRLVRRAVAAIAISALGTVALILFQARDDGRGVRRGQVRHPTVFAFVPFGSWGADAAWVEWVGGEPPEGFARGQRRCLLYLGQANGTAVFYDARAPDERTIRVPATAVVVTTRNSRRSGERACG